LNPRKNRFWCPVCPNTRGDVIEFVDAADQVTVRRHDEGSRFQKYRGFLRLRRGQDPDVLLDELRGEP